MLKWLACLICLFISPTLAAPKANDTNSTSVSQNSGWTFKGKGTAASKAEKSSAAANVISAQSFQKKPRVRNMRGTDSDVGLSNIKEKSGAESSVLRGWSSRIIFTNGKTPGIELKPAEKITTVGQGKVTTIGQGKQATNSRGNVGGSRPGQKVEAGGEPRFTAGSRPGQKVEAGGEPRFTAGSQPGQKVEAGGEPRTTTGGLVTAKAPLTFQGQWADGVALFYSNTPTGYPVSGGNRTFFQEPSHLSGGLFQVGPAVASQSLFPFSAGPRSDGIFLPSEVKQALSGNWLGTSIDGLRRDTLALFNQETCRLHATVHSVDGVEDLIYEIPRPPGAREDYCQHVQVFAGRWGSSPTVEGQRVCDPQAADIPGLYDPETGEFTFFKLPEGIKPEPGNLDPLPLLVQSRIQFGPQASHAEMPEDNDRNNPHAIIGDWNGDGCDDLGVYVKSSGVFFLKSTFSPGAADFAFPFGAPNSYPVAGNWNGIFREGSGKPKGDTIGIFRQELGSSNFFLRNTLSPGGADQVVSFGPAYSDYYSSPLAGRWYNSPRVGLLQPLPAPEKTITETWPGSQLLFSGTLGLIPEEPYNEGGLPSVREVILKRSDQSISIRDYTAEGNSSSSAISPVGQTQLKVALPQNVPPGDYQVELKSVRGTFLTDTILKIVSLPAELPSLAFFTGKDSLTQPDFQVVLPAGGACVIDEEVALGNTKKEFRAAPGAIQLKITAVPYVSFGAKAAGSQAGTEAAPVGRFLEPLSIYRSVDDCAADMNGTVLPFPAVIPAGSSHGFYSVFYPEIADETGSLVPYEVVYRVEVPGGMGLSSAPERRVRIVPEDIRISKK